MISLNSGDDSRSATILVALFGVSPKSLVPKVLGRMPKTATKMVALHKTYKYPASLKL